MPSHICLVCRTPCPLALGARTAPRSSIGAQPQQGSPAGININKAACTCTILRACRLQMSKNRIGKPRRASRRSRYGITRIDSKPHRVSAPTANLEARFSRSVVWRQSQGTHRRKSVSRPDPQPPMSPAEYCRIKRRNNKSGLAGVCCYNYRGAQEWPAVKRGYWLGSGRSRPARLSGSSSRSVDSANEVRSSVQCAHATTRWQSSKASGSILRACGIGRARAATLTDSDNRYRASLASVDLRSHARS
jgi:hypothetical protein